MDNRTRRPWIWLLLLAGASVVVLAMVLIFAPGYLLPGHKELTSFYSKIALGQTKDEVLQTFRDGKYLFLTLSTGEIIENFERQDSEWVVTTPSRLSQEWIAVLEYSGDTLVATYISVLDAPRIPPGAPRPRPERELNGWGTVAHDGGK